MFPVFRGQAAVRGYRSAVNHLIWTFFAARKRGSRGSVNFHIGDFRVLLRVLYFCLLHFERRV